MAVYPSDIITKFCNNENIRTANKKGSVVCDSVHLSKEIVSGGLFPDIPSNLDELKGLSLTVLPYSAAIKYSYCKGAVSTDLDCCLAVLPIKIDVVKGGYEFCPPLLHEVTIKDVDGEEGTFILALNISDIFNESTYENEYRTIYEVMEFGKPYGNEFGIDYNFTKDLRYKLTDESRKIWEKIKREQDGYQSNICALAVSDIDIDADAVLNIMYVEMSGSFMNYAEFHKAT